MRPTPDADGANIPDTVSTPGPEYWPPGGNPPRNRNGFAAVVVIVSKHTANETAGIGCTFTTASAAGPEQTEAIGVMV